METSQLFNKKKNEETYETFTRETPMIRKGSIYSQFDESHLSTQAIRIPENSK